MKTVEQILSQMFAYGQSVADPTSVPGTGERARRYEEIQADLREIERSHDELSRALHTTGIVADRNRERITFWSAQCDLREKALQEREAELEELRKEVAVVERQREEIQAAHDTIARQRKVNVEQVERIVKLEAAVKEANERAWAYQSRPLGDRQIKAYEERIKRLQFELGRVVDARYRTIEWNKKQTATIRGLRGELEDARKTVRNLQGQLAYLSEKLYACKAEPLIDWKTADIPFKDSQPGEIVRTSSGTKKQPGRITRHLTPREDELFLEALRNAMEQQS